MQGLANEKEMCSVVHSKSIVVWENDQKWTNWSTKCLMLNKVKFDTFLFRSQCLCEYQ